MRFFSGNGIKFLKLPLRRNSDYRSDFSNETSTRCFNNNKGLGIFDLSPLFNVKQEPRYKEDATNGCWNLLDKSIVNATENSDKFE